MPAYAGCPAKKAIKWLRACVFYRIFQNWVIFKHFLGLEIAIVKFKDFQRHVTTLKENNRIRILQNVQ